MRFGIAIGSYCVQQAPLPIPPVEWKEWKRERLSLCLRAANLFLIRNYDADEIAELVGKTGKTKQLIALLVRDGMRWMIDRGYIFKSKKKA